MTPARAVPQPAGRLAAAGGLALVVAVALYIFGQTHTPSYTMGLFGQHGIAVNRLKAQLATGMLGLALVQLTLALWMYRRLPGAGAGAASRRRRQLVPALAARRRALHVRLRRAGGRPAGGAAFRGQLFLLRRVRGQGADRAEPSAAGLGAAGGGRPARHPDRGHVVLERAVVLRRLPPAPAVTWSQARLRGQGSGFTMPSRWAMVAASTRLRTPSLPRMLETCTVAVLGLMNSVSAIWALVCPIATSASTSCSRAVRPSRSNGDGGWGPGGGLPCAAVPRSRRPRRARASISARSGAASSALAVACAARSGGSTRSRARPPSSSASASR